MLDQSFDLIGPDVEEFTLPRHAGVSRSDTKFAEAVATTQGPGQRVLTTAATDEQDVHLGSPRFRN